MFKNSSLLFFTALAISVFSGHSKAENFVCGTDLDGDGFSDGQGETTACIKTSTSNNFCPLQAQQCNAIPVKDLNQTACIANGGNWTAASSSSREQTHYYNFGGGNTIIVAIGSESALYSVWWSGNFQPNYNGSVSRDYLNGNNANKGAPWDGRPSLDTNDEGTDTYYPGEWTSWKPLPNGRFYLYNVDARYFLSYRNARYMRTNGTGWLNASNYFASPALSNGESIASVSYHIKAQEKSSRNNGVFGVYLKATYRITTAAGCSFADGRPFGYISPIEGKICQNVNGNYLVPVHECVDMDTSEPEEEFDISGNMLTDDGRRDGEGNCIDTMMLFVGRGQSCKTPGMDSAWQNCCSYDGEVMNENTGSISQVGNTVTAIKGIYSISKAAYTAYSTAVASGATTGAAASAATSAASSQALVAFDPTTLAVAAAVYLVTDFIAKACIGGDMDTAAAVSSGHCIEVGTYCSKRYKFIGCVQRKRSFCCFNGKMQRIFHEQGRSQLTTFNGFGSAKEPDCRGYTPEEFQALDFSKMDLSEYYEDLNHNSSVEVQKTMTTKTQEFYNNVK